MKYLVTCACSLLLFVSMRAPMTPADDYERDYADAERLYQQFRRDFLEIKNVNREEAEKMITAICEAEEDDRKTVSRDASSRVRSTISAEYNQLENNVEATTRAFKKASESLKKAKSDAAEYKKNGRKIDELLNKTGDAEDDMATKWSSVKKMTAGIRGGNHPAVAWMMEAGQAAHEDRQRSSQFLVTEFTAGNAGRIDCLSVDGSELIVVELKPYNVKARNKGKAQLNDYIAELQRNWKTYKTQLTSKNSKFATVTKISGRIDCYTLCPAITDDGSFEKSYVKWSQSVDLLSPKSL